MKTALQTLVFTVLCGAAATSSATGQDPDGAGQPAIRGGRRVVEGVPIEARDQRVVEGVPIATGSQRVVEGVPIAAGGQPVVEGRRVDRLVSFEFPGGSITELVALLRHTVVLGYPGTPAPNIVVPNVAGQVQLPAMQLQQVDVATVLDALQPLVTADYSLHSNVLVSSGGSKIYAMQVVPRGPVAPNISQPPRTVVLSLDELIRQVGEAPALSSDTVLTAVEAGLKLAGSLHETELAFHEASGLLFVRGSRESLELVDNTLSTLRMNLVERRRIHDMEKAATRRVSRDK